MATPDVPRCLRDACHQPAADGPGTYCSALCARITESVRRMTGGPSSGWMHVHPSRTDVASAPPWLNSRAPGARPLDEIIDGAT